MRISNSFSEDEVQVLEFITQTLLRGGDPRIATRNKAFASVCRKIIAMRAKVNELKHRAVREESSVGTVSAPSLSAEAAEAAESAEAHDVHEDIAAAG